MPIQVFRIERGKKNRTVLKPGIGLEKRFGESFPRMLSVEEQSVHIGSDLDVFKIASSVYTAPEIDQKITDLDKKLEDLRTSCSADIQRSVEAIEAGLAELKEQIIGSRTLRMALKEEILEELRTELRVNPTL